MQNIRSSVFETNSSSTHSICIAQDPPLNIASVHFRFGEFGWERDTLNSLDEKASYLYTAAVNYGAEGTFDKVKQFLLDAEVNFTCEEKNSKDLFETGYIDHGDELGDFLSSVCENRDNLFSFLFSDLSFIITGNDNDEGNDVSINVDYPHQKFYKGN